ncbi:MAG: hypothetical protein ACLQAN_07115 [Acidimicrobiales bacterium]
MRFYSVAGWQDAVTDNVFLRCFDDRLGSRWFHVSILGEQVRGRGTVLAFSFRRLFSSLFTENSIDAFALLFGQITGETTWDLIVTVAPSAIALGAIAAVRRPLLLARSRRSWSRRVAYR